MISSRFEGSARVSSLVRWWCNKLEGMKLHRRTLFPLIYQRRPSYGKTYVNQENINHKPRSDIHKTGGSAKC